MNMEAFEKIWEAEYICRRVRMITAAVADGSYEEALDYLMMVQEKAKLAAYEIKEHQKDKKRK